MKISRIQIKDFLGIESLDLDLRPPINIIVGANEAGKSSIRDAIQWCLTGQARGLKTHQEQAALIRNGAKAAEVEITLKNGQTCSRRKTPRSPAVLNGKIPGNSLSPAILCDPLTFLSLPENQRRELLFALIPGLNPGAPEITGRLKGFLIKHEVPAGEDMPNAAANRLARLAADKGFQSAAAEAVAMRREAKRLRDSLGQVREPETRVEIGDRSYILPDIDKAEVEAALAGLKRQRDRLLKQKGAYEAHQKRVSEIEAKLADVRGNIPPGADKDQVEELTWRLIENKNIQAEIQGKINRGQYLEEIFPEFCPAIYGDRITCPQAGKVGFARPGLGKAEMGKLWSELEQQKRLVEELKQSLAEAEAKDKGYNDALARIKTLEEELARLKTETPAGPAPGHDPDAEIAELDRRINNGQVLLSLVKDFWAEQEQAEQARARLAEIENEITLYDTLAKALAPDGIPSRMIAEALEPVNELLKTAADSLFPGRSLILTPDLMINLSGSPYATLSKSAKFRVGIAFQYALAKLAGARLLMIDEADVLDPLNRANLVEFLCAVKDDFDTILIFATSDRAYGSPLPEIRVWWLEDGRITRIEEKLAA